MSTEVNLVETMIGTPIIYRLVSHHPIWRKYCPKFVASIVTNIDIEELEESDAHIGAAHINFLPDATGQVSSRIDTSRFCFPEFFRKIGIAYNIPADKIALLKSEYIQKDGLEYKAIKISQVNDFAAPNFPISEEEFANYKRAASAFWKKHHKLPMIVTIVDFTEYCKTNCCNYCGKPATLTCQKCLKVKYCSRDCQRLDWPTHKGVCRPPVPVPAPATPAPVSSLSPKKVNNSDPVLPRAVARAVASAPARPSAPLLMIENAPRLLMIKNAPAPAPAPANFPVVYSPPFRPAPGTARPRPPPPKGYKGKGGKKTRKRRYTRRHR
jgi:hypothetical protein